MRTDPRPDEVRRLVKRVLQDFGEEFPPGSEPEETVLIDAGHYVARSYRTEAYLAMWLVSVGILQFYAADGEMLSTINLLESLHPQRMAA